MILGDEPLISVVVLSQSSLILAPINAHAAATLQKASRVSIT
jgi:hypothetical protein